MRKHRASRYDEISAESYQRAQMLQGTVIYTHVCAFHYLFSERSSIMFGNPFDQRASTVETGKQRRGGQKLRSKANLPETV